MELHLFLRLAWIYGKSKPKIEIPVLSGSKEDATDTCKKANLSL
jgi:hypothetical protein